VRSLTSRRRSGAPYPAAINQACVLLGGLPGVADSKQLIGHHDPVRLRISTVKVDKAVQNYRAMSPPLKYFNHSISLPKI
jgi:hypothetical protein